VDTAPPDPTMPDKIQHAKNKLKIVDLTTRRQPPAPPSAAVRTSAPSERHAKMDLKIKLDNYRSIFNNSPKNSAIEKKAIAKMAELVRGLPDDDKDKHEYLRLALDFHEGADDEGRTLFDDLVRIADAIADGEDRAKTYRILLRNKYADDVIKETIGEKMLALLETL